MFLRYIDILFIVVKKINKYLNLKFVCQKDGRSISRETLEYLRSQSIKLWKKSKEIEDIADFCGLHWTAVYKWIRIYKEKGVEGLKRRKARGIRTEIK